MPRRLAELPRARRLLHDQLARELDRVQGRGPRAARPRARCAKGLRGARPMTGAELKALRKALGLSVARASRQIEVSAGSSFRLPIGPKRGPRLRSASM